MLVLVRWVIAAAPIGVFALVLPLAAHGGGTGRRQWGSTLPCIPPGPACRSRAAAVSRGRHVSRAYPRRDSPVRCFRAAHRGQLELIDGVAAGAGGGRGGVRPAESCDGASCCRSRCRCSRLPAPVSWTVGALFVGVVLRNSAGPRELGTIAFASIFLPLHGPGVPRGAFLMLTPLFVSIGLPAEGIGILIAVDAIPDVFSTVLNVTGDLAAAAIIQRGESTESAAGA